MPDQGDNNSSDEDRLGEAAAAIESEGVDARAAPADEPFEDLPPAPWAVPDRGIQPYLPGDDGNGHRNDVLGNHWSVPWSDLMMSMFVLFAALVAAQALERKVPEYIDREIERPVEKDVPDPQPSFAALTRINVFEQSRQAIRDADIDNVEIALMDDQSVKLSVQGPLFFDSGTDELRADVRQFLTRLAQVIGKTRYRVHVIGHTDDTPIHTDRFPSNWELSLMRATRVTRHLIDVGGVEPARFTIMGRSQYEPVASNSDQGQRGLNRRVDIVITRDIAAGTREEPQ